MHVILVFFNKMPTDYLVIGPYKTLRELQHGMTKCRNAFVGADTIESVALRSPPPYK